MIEKNFSNFSAWHHRTKVINNFYPDLVDDNHRRYAFFFYLFELSMLHNAIYTDPYDQSPWIYYSWLLSQPSHLTEPHIISISSRIVSSKYVILMTIKYAHADMEHEICDSTFRIDQTLLNLVNIMVSVNIEKYQDQINTMISHLISVDEIRSGFYSDLKSKMNEIFFLCNLPLNGNKLMENEFLRSNQNILNYPEIFIHIKLPENFRNLFDDSFTSNFKIFAE
ncbi:LOW QUALITY PROTEIN: hypothetical protein MXB_5147, partial [Myxobolus squamalis]